MKKLLIVITIIIMMFKVYLFSELFVLKQIMINKKIDYQIVMCLFVLFFCFYYFGITL